MCDGLQVTATYGPGRGLCLKLSSGQFLELGGLGRLDQDPSPSHSLQLHNNSYHENSANPFQHMCVQPGVSQWHSRYTHSCVTTRWLNLQLLLEYTVDDAKKKKKKTL